MLRTAVRSAIFKIKSECDALPSGTLARSLRMSTVMFEKLRQGCIDTWNMDITRLPSDDNEAGTVGMVANLPIFLDDSLEDGAVDIGYDRVY